MTSTIPAASVRRAAPSEPYPGVRYIVKLMARRGLPIETMSVLDAKTGEVMPMDWIRSRGIASFGDRADLKESLNWNLGGDSARFCCRWAGYGSGMAFGTAIVFD